MHNTTPASGPTNSKPNVICSCNCSGTQPQGMDISELEFVQIIIILVVMMVMVVVIICLLNHYWLSALAFLGRHGPPRPPGRRRRDQATQLVMYGPQGTQERLVCSPPSYGQQQPQHLGRFQPTYPYLQQDLINLPPSISLSDGEELPPYKGPCTLKLRDPEQQLELSRASVRAPPNRTVYDRNFIDIYVGNHGTGFNPGGGGGAANARMESPPPTYSEVMGQYNGAAAFYSQFSNNTASSLLECGSETGGLWLERPAGRRDSESTAATSGGESRRKRHGGGGGGGGEVDMRKLP